MLHKILSAVKIEVFKILQDQKSFTERVSACSVKFNSHIYEENVC